MTVNRAMGGSLPHRVAAGGRRSFPGVVGLAAQMRISLRGAFRFGLAAATLVAAATGTAAGGTGGETAKAAPKLYPLATKIDDLDISGADGALRSPKRGCEANRPVVLKYSPSFGETDDWTAVASTRADRGGFWEIEQPLGTGAYQAVVERKMTSEYRCKKGFSDIEELFG